MNEDSVHPGSGAVDYHGHAILGSIMPQKTSRPNETGAGQPAEAILHLDDLLIHALSVDEVFI